MPENLQRILIRGWHFIQAVWKQFKQDNILIRSSGLAYSTLLAIVPLAAVLFALFTAFGALDDLKKGVQQLLVDQFLPTRQDELTAILNELIENADKFGFVGFAFLAVTAILLLNGIESNFNDVWHVQRRRRLVSRITANTSVLVLGSLFLGASLSASARIKALLFSGTILDRSLIRRTLDWSLPLALTLLGFLLLYMIVPYTRVKWKSALFGALVAGIGWEVAKNVFANSVGQSARYSILYGSLAAIPIFLVWLYVTWVIVLLGLVIAYTHQHFDFLEKDLRLGDGPKEGRLSLTLKTYALIAQKFHDAAEPPTTENIAERLLISQAVAEKIVGFLEESDLVRRTTTASESGGLVPSMPLDQVQLADVLAVFVRSSVDPLVPSEPLEKTIDDVMGDLQAAAREALGEKNFKQLVDEIEAAGLPAG
ncbi:MAG: YihY family inner membrane protein [Acidobacteria bacterium]|nr:MAG: YihY family inner membrane protein [Acidobacteriota bacterium]